MGLIDISFESEAKICKVYVVAWLNTAFTAHLIAAIYCVDDYLCFVAVMGRL